MTGMRIGVDVGGTFTDAVLIEDDAVWTAKSPTTPNFADGVIAACELASSRDAAPFRVRDFLPADGRRHVGAELGFADTCELA